MARRHGSVHVATTRRAYKGRVYESHLLRRTYREGKQVKHETLGNISHLPPHVIDMIRRALRGETFVAASDSLEVTRTLPHGHVAVVLQVLKKLQLDRIISARPSPELSRVLAMIVARVVWPASKMSLARALSGQTAISTLSDLLGIEDVSEDQLYAAMDWLLKRQNRIEKRLASKHLSEGSLVLYDLTSTYYTGRHCPLAHFGHNRDGKKRFPQVEFGLLCSRDGCPIAVSVFPGNTADPKTVNRQVQKLRTRFNLQRVVIVGDRGMITAARIRDELAPLPGVSWITALRNSAIRKLADANVVQPGLFDETDLAEIQSPDYPGERLILCRNPLLAKERSRKRQELLAETEEDLKKLCSATRRRSRPLRGKERISVRLDRLLRKHKVRKHFIVEVTETGLTYRRNEESIEAEARLDGIYIIRSNLPKKRMSPEQLVAAYKDLSRVERAFRSLKTVDLKVRPIFHRDSSRVKAHIFICVLAYYVEWHMRQALAPMLFDDDDKDAAAALRRSIVAPARKSPRALRKAAARTTEEGTPVQSFHDLVQGLGCIARNTIQTEGGGSKSNFHMLTTPSPWHRKALKLLGLSSLPTK